MDNQILDTKYTEILTVLVQNLVFKRGVMVMGDREIFGGSSNNFKFIIF